MCLEGEALGFRVEVRELCSPTARADVPLRTLPSSRNDVRTSAPWILGPRRSHPQPLARKRHTPMSTASRVTIPKPLTDLGAPVVPFYPFSFWVVGKRVPLLLRAYWGT